MHGFGEKAFAQSTAQENKHVPFQHVSAADFRGDCLASNGGQLQEIPRFIGRTKIPAYTCMITDRIVLQAYSRTRTW